MIRVLELFAGIGACSKALTNLGIEHEIVDAVEIDKYAIKSFNAIHGTNFEPQDITTWNKDIKADLIMHGSPCQDFSVAGRGAGGDKGSGTRSSLMYETLRIVEKVKPKVVIWENVKNLLSKKHRHNFEAYIEAMEGLGYHSQYQVLNAKDYGVPQNRERVFTISLAAGWPSEFIFPPKQELTKRLKDVLENNVDEKYYLSDERVAGMMASTEKECARGNGFKFEPVEKEKIAHAVLTKAGGRKTDNYVAEPQIIDAKTTRGGGIASTIRASIHKQGSRNLLENIKNGRGYEGVAIRTANKKGYDMAVDGDGIDLGYPQSNTRRGRVGHGVRKTIPTSDSQGTLDGFRIRKLTPRECWRLMGFDDEDFDKAKGAGISNTQLYKQAGNSIVVDCLEAIIKGIEWGKNDA